MASHRKQNSQIKQFWKRILQQGKSFLAGSFLRVKHLFNHARIKIRSWPRFWQVSVLYLLVLLLTGSIYLWRTSQLRTINPYIEKINFGELEDEDLRGKSNSGVKEDGPDEPAAAPSVDPSEPVSRNKAPEPSFVWPVDGRSIILGYGGSTMEVLARLDQAVKWSFSKGLGIKAAPGEEVRSIGGGKVKEVNEMGKPYGKEVIIEHENNLTVYYGALDRVDIKEGDQVVCGKPIATVRKNPEGEEAYLYLEMVEDGRPVDPLTILPCS